ncbi:MAG: 50S ribosomal protein L2 [Candidatus Nealsonbacteria bacterium]|nr:50S ribosomal protein L2 [Candidatus Nealsonbacteria bacterium]
MKSLLTKKKPEKKLLITLKEKAGRARTGRITVRHRGGGVKRRYRLVDFGQKKINIPAKVIALEYDPCRTAFLMLLEHEGGQKSYQIAPQGIKIGDKIICQEKAEIRTGNRLKLKNITIGTMVYNVELTPGQGGKIVRSAGAAAKVLASEGKYVNLEMPSKEVRMLLAENYASVGMVSYPEWRYKIVGKAGRSRLGGRRPVVRGSAMNPVDHPHGGGEGRTSIGLKYPKTPWGKPALGVRTRKKKWTDKFIIQRRKKK